MNSGRNASDQLICLDGLRGFAAMLVLVSHAGHFKLLPPNAGNGQLGVMLFFVLSGFLMGHLYVAVRQTSFSMIDFWIKRFFRVMPLFLLVVIGSFLLNKVLPGVFFPVTGENILSHLLLNNGVWVLWTIPIEVKFYLIFPLFAVPLVLVKSQRDRLLICTAWLLFSFFVGRHGKFALVTYLNFFVMGIWLAQFRAFISLSNIKHRIFDLVFVAWIFSFLLVTPVLGVRAPLWGPGWWHDIPYLLWAGCGILVCSYASPIMSAIMANPVSRWIGSVSYGVYLLHYPLIRQMNKMPIPQALKFVAFLALIFAITWISAKFFEVPLQNFGRRLIKARQTKSTPSTIVPESVEHEIVELGVEAPKSAGK